VDSISSEETRRFVEPLLNGRLRVLEVGCGNGHFALSLARAGHEVTAIDRSLDGQLPSAAGLAFVQADLLRYDAAPFDAVVCIASLHHIAPPDAAINAVCRLLAPAGILVVDDFAVEAPDAATARWYFEIQELLAAAALISAERIHGSSTAEPLARWRDAHAHQGEPLVEGSAMQAAITTRLSSVSVERGPYLYRYIATALEEQAPAGNASARRLALHVLESERRKIADGSLAATGLRFVAQQR
jgi:2-polyprenyl-3-methyl-5-hydroxy-6-metoxy-1,4-benzoquinol methylase